MASEAQIQANRLNATKSTGPKTAEGKAVSAANAVSHGLFSRQALLGGESPERLREFRDGMLAQLHPHGELEMMLADRIVCAAWRLRRLARIESQWMEAALESEAEELTFLSRKGPARLGPSVKSGFEDGSFEHLRLYEGRIERSLQKTLSQLEHYQRLRREADVRAGREPSPWMVAEGSPEATAAAGEDDDHARTPDALPRRRRPDEPTLRELWACARERQLEEAEDQTEPSENDLWLADFDRRRAEERNRQHRPQGPAPEPPTGAK